MVLEVEYHNINTPFGKYSDLENLKEEKEKRLYNNLEYVNLLDIKNLENKSIYVSSDLLNFLKCCSNVNINLNKVPYDFVYSFLVDGELYLGYDISVFILLVKAEHFKYCRRIDEENRDKEENFGTKDKSTIKRSSQIDGEDILQGLLIKEKKDYLSFLNENNEALKQYMESEKRGNPVWNLDESKYMDKNWDDEEDSSFIFKPTFNYLGKNNKNNNNYNNVFSNFIIGNLSSDNISGCFYVEKLNAYLFAMLDKCSNKTVISIFPVEKFGRHKSRNLASRFSQYEDYMHRIIEDRLYPNIQNNLQSVNNMSNMSNMNNINNSKDNIINASGIFNGNSQIVPYFENILDYDKSEFVEYINSFSDVKKSSSFDIIGCSKNLYEQGPNMRKHCIYSNNNNNLKSGYETYILENKQPLELIENHFDTMENFRGIYDNIHKDYINSINMLVLSRQDNSNMHEMYITRDNHNNYHKNEKNIYSSNIKYIIYHHFNNMDDIVMKCINMKELISMDNNNNNNSNNSHFEKTVEFINPNEDNIFNSEMDSLKNENKDEEEQSEISIYNILGNNGNDTYMKRCSSNYNDDNNNGYSNGSNDNYNNSSSDNYNNNGYNDSTDNNNGYNSNSSYNSNNNNGDDNNNNNNNNDDDCGNNNNNNNNNNGSNNNNNGYNNGNNNNNNNKDNNNNDGNGSSNNNNNDDDEEEEDEDDNNNNNEDDNMSDNEEMEDNDEDNDEYNNSNDSYKYEEKDSNNEKDLKKDIIEGDMINSVKYNKHIGHHTTNKSEISTNYFENSCNMSVNNSNNEGYDDNCNNGYMNHDEGLTLNNGNVSNNKCDMIMPEDGSVMYENMINRGNGLTNNIKNNNVSNNNDNNNNSISCNGDENVYNNINNYINTYMETTNNKNHIENRCNQDSYSTNEDPLSNISLNDTGKMKDSIMYDANDLDMNGTQENSKEEGMDVFDPNFFELKRNSSDGQNKHLEPGVQKKISKKRSKVKHERNSKILDDEKKEVLNKVSQITRVGGVCFDKNRQRWIAHWKIDGKYHKHYFPISQYGFENARERAVSCRKQAEKLFNLPEIQPRNRWNQIKVNGTSHIKKAAKLPRCEGVGYDELSQSWVSTFVVHKKFSIEELGFYEAREKAIYCRKTFEKVNVHDDYEYLLNDRLGLRNEEKDELSDLINVDKNALDNLELETSVNNNNNKVKHNNNNNNNNNNGNNNNNNSNNSEKVRIKNNDFSMDNNNENVGTGEMKISNDKYLKITQEAIEMILSNIKHKSLPEIKMKLIDKQKFENYNTLLDKHFKFITSVKNISQLRPYISLFHKFIIYHTLPHNISLRKQLFIIEALEWSSFFSGAASEKVE
ncbi:transcription factor with AP2 domain(s) [Plasmodium gaboni]|uniref:Transcription factor with AP2 domain(S) n=1 Tax=Plasmodium gaboni TaxID=647221 RepID=A0A151LQI9_9APIC|nr:transcription factor with AP2 domain(s) [Plasmodium gaboni]KYO01436.1 transcription factor with AP2 domain(s) [Plasmodium gaboni]